MITNEQILEKIEELAKEIKSNKKEVLQAVGDIRIEFRQELKSTSEDIIDSISEVVNHDYNMHEERIVRIEDHLHLPPIKQ